MKKMISALFTMALIFQTGCSEELPGEATQTSIGQNSFYDDLPLDITEYPQIEINQEIIDGLRYMREEEKVARDVYIALGKKWNLRIFDNISQSEQRHMDALAALIERYELIDPVGSNAEGVFTNQLLQTMYTELVERGTQSMKESLLVGAMIEETDIHDLDMQLALVEEGSDLAFVYSNLRRGSVNHQNAFNRNLERLP